MIRSTGALFVGACVLGHIALLAYAATRASPTTPESSALVAGVYHWKTGRIDLYEVNPPLVRMWATIPVLLAMPEWRSDEVDARPPGRPEYTLGSRFILWNGREGDRFFVWARWMCIPISVIGSLTAFFWARELFGPAAGFLAIGLWSVSPSTLAMGQLMATDMAAGSFGLLASYLFWRWLKSPSWMMAILAGGGCGLACLSKTTWLILLPLWPTLWCLLRFVPGCYDHRKEALQMTAALSIGLAVIHCGYLGDEMLPKLGEFRFASAALSGEPDVTLRLSGNDNRFRGGWLEGLPLPLPRSLVVGVDLQRFDFEQHHYSYLRGTWRSPGWWYYYLYAIAVKEPCGLIVLVLLALCQRLRSPFAQAINEVPVLAPCLSFCLLVSMQTGMNEHFRYIFPVIPFLIVWVSSCGTHLRLSSLFGLEAVLVCTAVVSYATSSLMSFPHAISHFNEIVGGGRSGYRHLLGSHIDVGQDLGEFERWCKSHPEAGPFEVRLVSPVPRELWKVPIAGNCDGPLGSSGPEVRWYALSVNELWSRDGVYSFLQSEVPVAYVSDSIVVFRHQPHLSRAPLP
jgi:hypothetical protein